jgi:hypothetical protein
MVTQALEQKTESIPIDTFCFNPYSLWTKNFEEILKSYDIKDKKTDSYYYTSKNDIRQEEGQGPVEYYYFGKEKRNLMKKEKLLLTYYRDIEEEWRYDGYDQTTFLRGNIQLFIEDLLARKIFNQIKELEQTKELEQEKYKKYF